MHGQRGADLYRAGGRSILNRQRHVDAAEAANLEGEDSIAMKWALKDARMTRKASADDLFCCAQDCHVATVMRPYREAVAHD